MGRCAKRQGSAAIPLLQINIRPPQLLNGSRSGCLILSVLDSRRSERDMVRLRNHREIGIGEFAIVVGWLRAGIFANTNGTISTVRLRSPLRPFGV